MARIVSLKPAKVTVEPLKIWEGPSDTPFFNRVTETMFAVPFPVSVMVRLVTVTLVALGLVRTA